MDIGTLKSDWAAWLALLPGLIVVFFVTRALFQRSARGQLSQALKAQRQSRQSLLDAQEKVAKTTARLEKLLSRSDKVKPRILEETRGALDDCRALEKILDDKCQVTTNHLRRVIFEEFPPSQHEELRGKYLPQDVEDGRPFSF
ncbi:MAG: hypothetical protein OEM63_07685 [Gammaproteobacteria bacterium]|nr:hypothetical protein [Gammaproteobacteria bacterium]